MNPSTIEKKWLSPKIGWRAFKKLSDAVNKFVNEQGPYPMHIDKVLWQMLRDRQINMYLDMKQPEDPLVITLKSPETSTK